MHERVLSAGGVMDSTAPNHGAGRSSTLTAALHNLRVQPIPFVAARRLLVRNHYLHSLPGGTMLSFGIFLGKRLLGALTLGAGPSQAYQLVKEANPEDCVTLSRLWLSDELPKNSESRTMGFVLRSLQRHTSLKFLVSYSDPSQGHLGTIYQATGWLYTGLSSAMSLYDLGDGILRHSRSVANAFGTHSVRYFQEKSVDVKLVPQVSKHRYIRFLDETWGSRLTVPVLQYPKQEKSVEK